MFLYGNIKFPLIKIHLKELRFLQTLESSNDGKVLRMFEFERRMDWKDGMTGLVEQAATEGHETAATGTSWIRDTMLSSWVRFSSTRLRMS